MQNALIEINLNNNKKYSSLFLQEKNRIQEFLYNGKLLDGEQIVINEIGEEKKINEIIDGGKLILRYSELNCNTCIDEQIKNITLNVDRIGVHNIILLTTYRDYVYMQKFRKVNKVKVPIYKMTKELEKELEDIDVPYYFSLGNDLRINNMFVPISEAPDLTKLYLEAMITKYYTVSGIKYNIKKNKKQ